MTDPNTAQESAPKDQTWQVESFVPPITTAAEFALPGEIGPEPEDFRVDEIPLYQASGEGQHYYVNIQKRLLTTQNAISAIAKAASIKPREIGSAGMKDKHGVTSQWFSVLDVGTPSPDTWELPPGLELLSFTRHGNKLRTGHLMGNRFRIRVNAAGAVDGAALQRQVKQLVQSGVINYYGAQRFGRGTENLSLALAWLRDPKARRQSRFLEKLYPSVVQSEVFNRYLARRTAAGLDQLLSGEVVRLDHTSKMFVVEDPAVEQPRLASGDVHLTGPLPGPKMKPAAGEVAALEQEVLAELELGEPELKRLSKSAPGARRDLIVPLEHLQATPEDHAYVLEFALPAGSYATQVVREFTHGPWTVQRRKEAAEK